VPDDGGTRPSAVTSRRAREERGLAQSSSRPRRSARGPARRVSAMYRRTSRLVFAIPESVTTTAGSSSPLKRRKVAQTTASAIPASSAGRRSCVPTRRSGTGDLLITKGRRRLLGGPGGWR
jgi:hypothetical protein